MNQQDGVDGSERHLALPLYQSVRRSGGRGSRRAVWPRIGFAFTLLLADGTRSVPATLEAAHFA